MSDKTIRKLEKQMAQSPADNDLKVRWIMEKNKMGEATVETVYKIAHKDKYYSESSYRNPWTKRGTGFKTRGAAIKALDAALRSKNNWRHKKNSTLKDTNISEVKLVEISTYTVEQKVEIDFVQEKTKADLEEIKKMKEELKKREEKILERAKQEREALLKKEQKLLRKINKK